MKTILLLLSALVLVVGCDKEPKLKVTTSSRPPHDALRMLGAQSYIFDIEYSGEATKAEFYMQTYKGGQLTQNYKSLGGMAKLASPTHNMKMKVYLDIFDSRRSEVELTTKSKVNGDFYQIMSYAQCGDSGTGGGDVIVSTETMDLGSWRTWSVIDNPDLSKQRIPISFLKCTSKGSLDAGLQFVNGEPKVEEGYDYVVFYLEVNDAYSVGMIK